MKIGFALTENKGKESKIAEHFGQAEYLGVYDSKKDDLKIKEIGHGEGCVPIHMLEKMGADSVYAYELGIRAMNLCKKFKIKMRTGKYAVVDELIDNLDNLDNLLESCGH